MLLINNSSKIILRISIIGVKLFYTLFLLNAFAEKVLAYITSCICLYTFAYLEGVNSRAGSMYYFISVSLNC